jgi:16S rRNA (guanine527-N7)-methyltransferase
MTGPDSAFPFRREILRAAEAQGISLSDDQVRSMEIHRDLLMAWGGRMNLTAIRDPGEMVRRHFLEGLLAGKFLGRCRASGTVLDLGSGNGFPAVPIRVARPEAAPLILVESSRKRAAFLRALLRELGWVDSRVEVRRVEGSGNLRDLPCDIFTTRGVTPFGLLEEGLPFLKRGGFALLFMRRSALDAEIPRLPPGLRVEAESPLEGRETGMILLAKQ